MVSRTSRCLVGLSIPLFACGQPWVQPTDNGSTVVYEPVHPSTPDRPPARMPSAPAFLESPARDVVEVRRGGSVIRYVPIDDPGSDLASDDDASHSSPGAPIEDEPEHAGLPGSSHDLPFEDRPSTMPPLEPTPANVPVDPSIYGVHLTADGLALPYPTTHMFRGFGRCRGHRHHHEAIDLGGVGPDWGVGTPIRSMAMAEVVFVGTGEENPDDFGTPDRRDGEAVRGDRKLPRWKHIEPYGRVHFFTKRKGRWRSGNLIATRVLEGPLAGHTIRYLHVADVHPDVRVGAIVARGQEIALMGGTGVQESAPHLHLDIQAPDGRRLDVAPLLGLAPTASCRAQTPAEDDTRSRSTPAQRDTGDDDEVRAPKRERERLDDKPAPRATGDRPSTTLALRDVSVARCRATTRHEDFTSGRYDSHTTELRLVKGQKLTLEIGREKGQWKPRLQVDGDAVTVKTLASGKIGKKAITTVTATADTAVRVTIGGWTSDLPNDAAYAFSVSEKCRARR